MSNLNSAKSRIHWQHKLSLVSAMDRVQFLLLGLPLFLLCTDIINLFSPPPPKPAHHHRPPQSPPETLQVPTQIPHVGGGEGGRIGLGNTVKIDFCSSCSYRGTAVTMKRMLETQFPGINVVLANYPPPMPKRLVAKLVPAVQIGVIAIVVAGEHIFPMLGLMTPPPWYYNMRANKFGTIASTWLLGNALQSFLQGSGAFEVYCNNQSVFSKLREGRFPGEIELKDLVEKTLTNPSSGRI